MSDPSRSRELSTVALLSTAFVALCALTTLAAAFYAREHYLSRVKCAWFAAARRLSFDCTASGYHGWVDGMRVTIDVETARRWVVRVRLQRSIGCGSSVYWPSPSRKFVLWAKDMATASSIFDDAVRGELGVLVHRLRNADVHVDDDSLRVSGNGGPSVVPEDLLAAAARVASSIEEARRRVRASDAPRADSR